MKIGRNDPCPCGSGKKYKKCHLAANEAHASAALAEVPECARHVERDGETYGVSSGVTDDQLELAAKHFAKGPGRGPAQQMVEFVQPLLDQTDGSIEAMNKAMSVGMVCWNMAIVPAEERDRLLAEFVDEAFPDEEARAAFREIAQFMIARHRQMFPEIHAGRVR
jgi:hypothetical protein